MRVVLIGARGCGKTTVGKLLAEKLSIPFVDLDERLTQREGRSIEAIVAAEGWEKFRDLETEILRGALSDAALKHAAISTGGGAVLREANRALLRASGAVVWLRASPEALLARLLANPLGSQRPPLASLPLDEEIKAVLREREPLYFQAAGHIIDAEEAPEIIRDKIIKKINGHAAKP